MMSSDLNHLERAALRWMIKKGHMTNARDELAAALHIDQLLAAQIVIKFQQLGYIEAEKKK